ncbi:serine/threonine-protein kinase GIN4 [Phyllosticta capitalensis]
MDFPGRAPPGHHPKARRPLADAGTRINAVTPPYPGIPKGPRTTASPKNHPVPHNASIVANGNTFTVRNHRPAAENKHLTRVTEEQRGAGNRDSTISTGSNASASSRKRKTHIGPWQLGKTIGEGGCSRVRVVRHSVTGQLGAAKIISKKTAEKVKAQSLLNLYKSAETDPKLNAQCKLMPFGLEREIVIMKLLDHPNIVKLYDVWENRSELYLIMEYVEGGELFAYIDEHTGLDELEVVFIFRQIVAALIYCHRLHIHHRDLKPENILVDANTMDIKLVDFGMAALQPEGSWLSTPCGSPHYAAPEVIRFKQYDGGQADVWSCGVILYVMLTGTPPFNYNENQDLTHLFKLIAQARYVMPEGLSHDAMDLIRKILVPDPNKRINIEGVWNHPFMRKYESQFANNPRMQNLEQWIGARPRVDDWRPLCVQEIDREVLRNMRTLWHSQSEETILRRIMGPEANHEKYFYTALLKYREQQLESWPGDLSLGHSTSDYHHNQTFSRPQREAPRHQRNKSQFSIFNDEHLQATQTLQDPTPSEVSYDPFRSSREPSLANKTTYMNVTIHRSGSNASRYANRKSTNLARGGLGHTGSLRVSTLKKTGVRSSGLSSVGSRSSRRISAVPSAHRKSSSRSSKNSSTVWASSPPIVVRPSSSHKRGVSFAHLRKSSTVSCLTPGAVVAQSTPDQPKSQDGPKKQHKQDLAPPAAATPITPDQRRTPASCAGSVLKSVKPRLKIKRTETPTHHIEGEVRKASVELEKVLDEAFNRTSISSSVRSSTTNEKPSPAHYETPPSSVSCRGSGASAYGADVRGLNQADTHRPLPPLPSGPAQDSPNSVLNGQLVQTRESVARHLHALQNGDQTTEHWNHVLHSLDLLLGPQKRAATLACQGDQRSSSAPQPESPAPLQPLPIISEEDRSPCQESLTPNWQRGGNRSATAPVHAPRRYYGDNEQTIRVVDASSPAPAPLHIRKKASNSSFAPSVTPTPTRAYNVIPTSTLPATPTPLPQLRHKASRYDEDSIDVIETPVRDHTPSSSNGGKVQQATKKRSWFRRRTSDKDKDVQEQQQIYADDTIGSHIPPQFRDLDDREDRAQRKRGSPRIGTKPSESALSNSTEFPMRAEKKEPKKPFFLAGLFGKKMQEKKDQRLELSAEFSASSLVPSGLGYPPEVDPGTPGGPRYEGQNWLARFLHIKPASKVLCFQVGRGRVRQEIVRLLRDWRRYGIRDIVFDRATNVIQARVDKDNHIPSSSELKIKPVSFAAELFAVLEHGRRAQLCLVRFTQMKGAASSFRKVVDTLEDVFDSKGFLIEDEERRKEISETLNV